MSCFRTGEKEWKQAECFLISAHELLIIFLLNLIKIGK